jgi:class 3 adenylate cyclase
MRDLITAYRKCITDAVARFDGFIARYLGDGVLVYFGIPQAHENDAERGVRADWQPLLQSMASKLAQCSAKG